MTDPFGPRNFPPPYLVARQAQTAAPTDYENLLADAIEAAFADGVWELPALVARLNADGVRAPDGTAWTEARYRIEIKRLGGA